MAAFGVRAEIHVTVDHNDADDATARFQFNRVPPPSTNNTAAQGVFTVTDGEIDINSGGLETLAGSQLPEDQDAPDRNFFFAARQDGGIIRLDLKKETPVWQIDTYSWHPGSRAPQVYAVYGATGKEAGFLTQPRAGSDPSAGGWRLIARVDTRVEDHDDGGQYGVQIADPSAPLGDYRYLLFVCAATEKEDAFGNTFYSAIDVLDHREKPGAAAALRPLEKPFVEHSPDGKYEITIDTHRAPDMKQWAETRLAPALAGWYPKIVAYFPSDGYTAPQKFKIIIKPGDGVADTAGTRVNAYVPWLRKEEDKQSIGALVHEMVHVVQQYGGARHHGAAHRNPGWLVEGIADYYRWYHYEPQSHGADVSPRRAQRVRYNDSYRPTANFLNWVSVKYDSDLVPQLNALMRQGEYSDDFWAQHTGKSLPQLGADWKAALPGAVPAAAK